MKVAGLEHLYISHAVPKIGKRVSITVKDVTAYGTIESQAGQGQVQVQLDGTKALVWVPMTMLEDIT